MLLRDALSLTRGEWISLIGTDGKTTTMLRPTKELRDQGCEVLVTSTTQIVKPTAVLERQTLASAPAIIAGDATDAPVPQGITH